KQSTTSLQEYRQKHFDDQVDTKSVNLDPHAVIQVIMLYEDIRLEHLKTANEQIISKFECKQRKETIVLMSSQLS
ncbi:unnamed protein product, partial [Ceratitis capitata]